MATDTKGVPAAVAALTAPPEAPKAGVLLVWKFSNGQDYSVIVEKDDVEPVYAPNETGGEPIAWRLVTQDGREVTVKAAHVLVFESRNVTIKPRKVGGSDGG